MRSNAVILMNRFFVFFSRLNKSRFNDLSPLYKNRVRLKSVELDGIARTSSFY
jgi:hypothetical protein